jgi:colicin import membrane protein
MSTAKKTATRPSRATRTKPELKQQFEDVRSSAAGEVEQDATAAAARSLRAGNVKTAVHGLTPEAAAQKILSAKLEANRALDTVAEELLAKTEELTQVREALEIYTKELEEIHGKEVVASSTRVLLEEYAAKERELEARIEQLELDFRKKADEFERTWQEQRAEKRKTAEREDAEYQYRLTQSRKEHLDGLAEQDRQRGIKEADRQRELLLGWQQREATLKAQEADAAALRAKVEAFPAELDAAVKKEAGIVGNTVKRDYEHKIEVQNAQHNARVSILEGEKKALVDTNAQLAAQVTRLSEQLTSANNHIQKISSDALTSASGSAALTAVQNMLQNGGQQNKTAKA